MFHLDLCVLYTVSFHVCVCVFVRLRITDYFAEDKATGVKFCTVVHRRPRQGISHFVELWSPRGSRSPKFDILANSVFISENMSVTL